MTKFFQFSILTLAIGLAAPVSAHEITNETTEVVFQNDLGSRTGLRCSGFTTASPCQITTDATSSNCRVRFIEIVGTFTVSYAGYGRQDKATKSHVWRGDSCSVKLPWLISDEVRGGDVAMTFSYRMTNGQTGSYRKAANVTGTNPDSATVRGDIADPIHAAAVFHATGFKHFDASGDPAVEQGFGVGALPFPDASEMWNWKANLTQRIAMLDAAFAVAAAHPAAMRAAGFVNLPDFTPDEHARQALQSLVGEPYYLPAPGGGAWVAVPVRHGYADQVMKIVDDVAAGTPPTGW